MMNEPSKERAWIELDLDALSHNVHALRSLMRPGCELMAVLKANAYGHGVHILGPALDRLGVRAYAVANADEAVHLRRLGVRGDILIFGATPPERAAELVALDLTQTLVDAEYARALSRGGSRVKCHLEVDTGMHRSGLPWEDGDSAAALFALPGLDITGVYTHLGSSDSLEPEDVKRSEAQQGRFRALLGALSARGIRIPKIHIQSTYGLLNYPELACGYARVGIALYGCLSYVDRPTKAAPDLRPVLSLRARVTSVRQVPAGEYVGYGRASVLRTPGTLAALSVGYYNGVPRTLSGGGSVLLHGAECPVLGLICMDNMTVLAPEGLRVRPGDIATLIGRDGDACLPAPLVAARCGAFTPELFGRLNPELPVVVRAV